MIEEFNAWLQDNSGLYASLPVALDRLVSGSRILAVGPFSLIAAAMADERIEDAVVELMCADDEALSVFRSTIDPDSRIPLRRSPGRASATNISPCS